MVFYGLALVLAVWFVVSGYKKGFTRSVLGFLGMLIAAVLASWLAFNSAEYIYKNFVGNAITSTVNSTLEDKGLSTPREKTQGLIDKLPSFLVNGLLYEGKDTRDIENIMTQKTQDTGDKISGLFEPVATGMIRTVLFFVFLSLLLLLFRGILKHVKLKKVPVLGKVDSLFGAVFGFLKYAVFMFVLLNIINFFSHDVNHNYNKIENDETNSTFFSSQLKNKNFDAFANTFKRLS